HCRVRCPPAALKSVGLLLPALLRPPEKNNWIYESQTLLIVALLAADPLYQSRREQNRLRAQRACRATGLRSGTPRQAGYRCTDRLAQRTRHRAFQARREELGTFLSGDRRG